MKIRDMKISFLLPLVAQPRYQKRVTALNALGVRPKILAFERNYFSGKPWPGGYISLGNLQHVNYHKRLLAFTKAFFKVRTAVKDSGAIYAFNLDLLLLGWIVSKTLKKRLKIIYEVADIQKILLGNSLQSRGIRQVERFLLSRVDLIVSTSEAYITEYYQGIQGLNDLSYHVIENKLSAHELPLSDGFVQRKFDGVLRIGYFGLIRCLRSWEILKTVAERANGRILVYVRGFLDECLEDVEKDLPLLSFIHYGGPYISPEDLSDIYSHVDMVWGCYPYQGRKVGNWKWARTNRFYEACYFGKPLFTAEGTNDARVTGSLNIGMNLCLEDIEGSVNRILRIENKDLEMWKRNVSKLPQSMYLYNQEHEILLTEIQRK